MFVIYIIFRSSDGQILVISSTDGYCTIVRFDSGELGVPLTNSELPVGARRVDSTNMNVSPPTVHTPVSVPSSNQTTPHREVSQVVSHADNSLDGPSRKPGPRRVQLITLSTTPQCVTAAAATTTTTTTTTSNATTQDNTSDTSTVTSATTANDVIIL